MPSAEIVGYKEKVDEKCLEVLNFIKSINKSLHGNDLRDKMIEMLSLMSRFGELMDKMSFKRGTQERFVDFVEALAIQSIGVDPVLSKIPATLKKNYTENFNISVNLSGGLLQTTLYDEKIKLEYYQYAYNRYRNIVELLKTSIMVSQSCLSFDRAEMKNISYS
mgnify:CR=1 FL=1